MADRRDVYRWLAESDITPEMMGPPEYVEHPVPTWEDFIADYVEHYFDDSAPLKGHCFIIELEGNSIGQVNYNAIHDDGITEMDIWLAGQEYTGHGYGTLAIELLCDHLVDTGLCSRFLIAPSLRNTRAIRSYMKAGFLPTEEVPDWFVPDYADTVVMIREMHRPQSEGRAPRYPPILPG